MAKNNKLDLQEVKAMFNGAPVTTVKIDDLELFAGTQQRLKPNTEGIETYAEAMEAGEVDNFPALRVVSLNEPTKLPDGTELEKGALILADGFTRVGAAEKVSIDEFHAEVVEGSLDDAVRYSWVANSMHGQKLDQKDYQALIRKVYLADPSIKKGDLARGLGCAAKTVSKALGIVEEEFKAKAHTMFGTGFSDKEIAAEVHKTEQTVKNWRASWEEEQNTPPPEDTPPPVNPMKLKFEQVLAMEDLDKQINLLEMLQARVDENRKKLNPEGATGAPEKPQEAANDPEQCNGTSSTSLSPLSEYESFDGEPPVSGQVSEEQGEIPFDVDGEEESQGLESMTCWQILGREKEQVAGLANPKASLKRSHRTAVKEVGEAAADAALAEALKELEA